MPTDKERLDALERFIAKEPLVLWSGYGKFPGGRLSGLATVNRSLREALDVLCEPASDGKTEEGK